MSVWLRRLSALTVIVVSAATDISAASVAVQGEVPDGKATARANAVAKPAPVKISAESKVKLAAAVGRVRALKGLKGEERAAGLVAAAQHLDALAKELIAERPAAARAWYECAEAWRRHGSLDAAQVAYSQALTFDDGPYQSRSLFGVAEMQRRQKQIEEATATYRQAAAIEPTSNRAHRARVWIARCLAQQGQMDEAMAAYQTTVDAASRTSQTIEGCNELAKALIKRGDLAAATAALARAETDCSAALAGGGPESDRVRKALDKMSARRALQRAKDKANDAAGDAVRLDEDQAKR